MKRRTKMKRMTKRQYKIALGTLGWTQADAAALFQVDPRTSRRWAIGESPVPYVVAAMLELLVSEQISAKVLER